jgi:hypothetical protein
LKQAGHLPNGKNPPKKNARFPATKTGAHSHLFLIRFTHKKIKLHPLNYSAMNFQFETEIIESQNAVNTAEKIAEILKAAKVTFGTSSGFPSIFVVFPGKESKWLASLQHYGNHDYTNTANSYGNWWTAYPSAGYGSGWNGHEERLFAHLTNAAKVIVKEWVEELCDEYERRLA